MRFVPSWIRCYFKFLHIALPVGRFSVFFYAKIQLRACFYGNANLPPPMKIHTPLAFIITLIMPPFFAILPYLNSQKCSLLSRVKLETNKPTVEKDAFSLCCNKKQTAPLSFRFMIPPKIYATQINKFRRCFSLCIWCHEQETQSWGFFREGWDSVEVNIRLASNSNFIYYWRRKTRYHYLMTFNGKTDDSYFGSITTYILWQTFWENENCHDWESLEVKAEF